MSLAPVWPQQRWMPSYSTMKIITNDRKMSSNGQALTKAISSSAGALGSRCARRVSQVGETSGERGDPPAASISQEEVRSMRHGQDQEQWQPPPAPTRGSPQECSQQSGQTGQGAAVRAGRRMGRAPLRRRDIPLAEWRGLKSP